MAELLREAADPGARPPCAVAAAASPVAQPHLRDEREGSRLRGGSSCAPSRFRGIAPKPTVCDPGGSPPLRPCPAGPSEPPRLYSGVLSPAPGAPA